MISVIIPSLMREDRLKETILELSKIDQVGEIILIDNSENEIQWEIPKLNHICEKRNTYINPAWNKGANIAKYDKLCFLNDDIWFDWNHLKEIEEWITIENGFIGMSSNNYENELVDFSILPINGRRPLGFACCFFVHKENWDPIPDEIKLWAGDDWVFYRSKKQNFVINIKCHGKMSGTLGDPELDNLLSPIKTNDMFIIKNYVKKGLVPNFLLGTIWWD